MLATVAIPVLNGGPRLEDCLRAVASQGLRSEIQLLVCDSGSTDGSVDVCRRFGAEVIEIPRVRFSHGATRNLLMSRAQGERVAFLTQDAIPADERWLERLLAGFELAPDVALAFGPYRPRSDASPIVARELAEWFGRLSPDGRPRIDRVGAAESPIRSRELLGPRGFFTDANGCVSRAAWKLVPFPEVAYAEDHALAHEMLRAGYAKVFIPDAPVIHSHEYSLAGWLRRSFDEARAVRGIYDFAEPADPASLARALRGGVGADWRWARRAAQRAGEPVGAAGVAALGPSLLHHLARTTGTALGARAQRLPRPVVERLSLEGGSD